MCKEAHDRFEYPWPVSRGVSVGGRGNNRKSDTDYRRYRDFSLVIATPFDTITRTTGDYEYQVSLHIRCLRYDTARSFLRTRSAWNSSAIEMFPNETFARVARISLLLSRKRKEDEGDLKKELKKTLE